MRCVGGGVASASLPSSPSPAIPASPTGSDCCCCCALLLTFFSSFATRDLTEVISYSALLLALLPAVLTTVKSAARLSTLVVIYNCAASNCYISVATRDNSLLFAATYCSKREHDPSTLATRFYSAASAESGGTAAIKGAVVASYYINCNY